MTDDNDDSGYSGPIMNQLDAEQAYFMRERASIGIV